MAKSPVYIFKTKIASFNFPKNFSSRKIAIIATPTKTLADLAYAILAAYKMGGEHLFGFERPFTSQEKELLGRVTSISNYKMKQEFPEAEIQFFNYYLPITDPDDHDSIQNENFLTSMSVFDAKLTRLTDELKRGLTFVYDFGDNWEFSIQLDDIRENTSSGSREYPKILSGRGINLAENEGPYDDLVKQVGRNPDYQFDLEEMNIMYKSQVSWLKEVYEHPEHFEYDADDNFEAFDSYAQLTQDESTSEMLEFLLQDKGIRKKVREILEKYKD